MKYLVFLDPMSLIGRTYSSSNDGQDTAGHPALNCSRIESQGPYLACTHLLASPGKSHQELLIPHSAVAYVLAHAGKADAEKATPLGFAPQS